MADLAQERDEHSAAVAAGDATVMRMLPEPIRRREEERARAAQLGAKEKKSYGAEAEDSAPYGGRLA